nr:hypothetical protein [Tanacetum cinerariifolium]
MGDENLICTLGDYSKPSHEGYIPVGNNVVPLRSDTIQLVQNGCSFYGLRSEDANQHLKDFLKLVDSLDLYGSITTWEDLTTRFLAQFFLSGRTAKLRNDPDYCMEDPEQAFVEYASSRTDEAGVLKAITNRIARAVPSDTVKNPNLNDSLVLSARSYLTIDPQCSSHPNSSINAIKAHSKEANISEASLLELRTRQKRINICPRFNIGLLEETDHIFGLANGTKFYPVGIVKDVEVHIGKLKLLNDFYVINMKKDPETPLLVGRGFLTTANAVIDCRMAKIVVGERITRSVFGVKGVDLGEEEAPYWTTLGKRESYKPRPHLDKVGIRTPYYARKDFLDCHLPREWEISRDAELNPFKDTLVFRRMVEFLGAIPINLQSNMWESKSLIKNPINWDKHLKNGDGAWHTKIRLIDSDEHEFTKTLQSIPTTRKLSERENPKEIIDLDHFYDT